MNLRAWTELAKASTPAICISASRRVFIRNLPMKLASKFCLCNHLLSRGLSFNLLKRERIPSRKYKTREEARLNVFDYNKLFYNPQRKHLSNVTLSLGV